MPEIVYCYTCNRGQPIQVDPARGGWRTCAVCHNDELGETVDVEGLRDGRAVCGAVPNNGRWDRGGGPVALGMFDGSVFDVFGDDFGGLSWPSIELGMGREPRWRGQTAKPWPIALHCISVRAVLLQMGAGLLECVAGLTHDVEEAVLGDWPTPVKRVTLIRCPSGEVIEYEELERRVRARCLAALGLPPTVAPLCEGPAVKRADRIVLHAEARVLCHPRMPGWLGPVAEEDEALVQWAAGGIRGMMRAPMGNNGAVAANEWGMRLRAVAREVVGHESKIKA